jgi:TolB-like protein
MIYRFDDFELDTDKFELRCGGNVRHVEPLVFDLICFLFRHAGRVVGRDEIMDHVWSGRVVSDATVSSCIKSARRALDDSGDSQSYIRTVRGRGFQFVVTESAGQQVADRPPAGAASDGGDHSHGKTAPEKPILAVLPFNNLSAGIEEYFSDGLTEDIITNLSRFRELLVIASTSTFHFKGRPVERSEVRDELRADYIVQGSVRRAAGRVRITVQLVDAVSGVHVWADRYDREMEDIFAVQDELTRTIAATLGVKIQDAALQRALKKSPAELDAYDSVLRARRYTSLLSAAMHAEARDLLEAAVAKDPTYADAHVLLANVYLAEYRFDTNPRPDPIGRALRMAQTATALDPQNAYAHCWLAVVHFFLRENDKFEAEAQRALSLNPNDPEILADIGHFLAFMGEFERGIELSRQAQLLNPLHPGWYHFSFCRYHYDKRSYQEALADVQRASMPDFYWTHLLSAASLGQLGKPEARASVDRIFQLKPKFSAAAELEKWNAAPRDFDHLMEGLRKAGLRG